jgi:hypothetical protein
MGNISDNGGKSKTDDASSLLTEFPIFSKLAFELRHMIWVIAAEDAEARVVEVVYNPKATWYSNEFPSKSRTLF